MNDQRYDPSHATVAANGDATLVEVDETVVSAICAGKQSNTASCQTDDRNWQQVAATGSERRAHVSNSITIGAL